MKKLIALLFLCFYSCSSTYLVENWKNSNIVLFNANKVLLVGMTNNKEARIKFENKLKKEFDTRSVESMRSIDVFDIDFTDTERTKEELDDVEQSLLDKDFDAILFTKVIGSESRQSFKKTIKNFNTNQYGFNEDYLQHQEVYYDDHYYENYTIYNAETSLYCICEGKERNLIWRGSINITDPEKIEKTINDYVKLVLLALEEQNLIFH